MKKSTIFTAAFLFITATTFSQASVLHDSFGTEPAITKGLRYFGGTLSFTTTKEKHESGGNTTDGPKTTNFSLIPSAGYVFSDKFVAGLGIGYTSMVRKRTESNPSGDRVELKDKYGQFVVRPMIGYYKGITNRLYFMPYFYLGFGFGNSSNEFFDYLDDGITKTESSLNSFEVGLQGSLKYFVAKEWALSLTYGSLFYNNTTQKDKENKDEKWKNSGFGLDLDLTSVSLGLVHTF